MNKKLYTFGITAILILFLSLSVYIHINNKENNKEEENGPSDALASLQFMSQVRAFPDADIPSDKFYKAFEYSSTHLQAMNNSDLLDQWNSIGPNNVGGRSLCIAVNPIDTATIYIGAASGGLWKSTTESWCKRLDIC